MITHVVIFWVDAPLEENRAKLLAEAKKLGDIPGVLHFHAGSALPSPRAAVDDSFAVAISMDFASQADADAYQDHTLHHDFIRACIGSIAKRFVVYDFAS